MKIHVTKKKLLLSTVWLKEEFVSKSKCMNCRNLKQCSVKYGRSEIGKQFKMAVKIPSINWIRSDSEVYPQK